MTDPTATKTVNCPRCGTSLSELAVLRAAGVTVGDAGLREAAEAWAKARADWTERLDERSRKALVRTGDALVAALKGATS